jgi:hypothetical protein
MDMHSLRGLAGSLLLLSISGGCGGGEAREEIAHSSRDQFARHLESLDEQLEALAQESEGRSHALHAASLVQRRSELERRLDELDDEAPTFTAERKLVEDDLFQLEADVATLKLELQPPVAALAGANPGANAPRGRVLPVGATGG